MKKQDALPIGDIISQFISEKNFGQKLDETQVMRLWPRIAGETVNSYTQSMYVHNALCASIICRSSQRTDDVAKRTSNPYQRRIRTSGYRQHYFQIKIKKQTMETTSPAFRHTLPLQLRFNDIDLLGHVNNSVYFSFYDLGKARYFETVKAQNIDWKKADVVVANVNADFLSPIYPGEPIAVQTCTVEIGNRSFKLLQQIVNTETGQIKGVCHTVMVGFDITAGRAAPISDEWKEALCRFEGKELRKK